MRAPVVFALLFCLLFPAPSQAETSIRVELTHAAGLWILCSKEFEVYAPGGQPIFLGRTAVFRSEADGISVNGKLFKTDGLGIAPNGPFQLERHHYRGNLLLHKDAGMLDAVNVVDLEEYLVSVVGSEMSARWPAEALKAQAVVARTYALEKSKERQDQLFDVVGTYMDQAYEGTEEESRAAQEAVDATRGEVLTYQGNLITAYYHADCGGRTEKGENVFPGDLPYLQSVACPYGHDSPYQHWSKNYSLLELSQRLGESIRNVTVTKDPETGRVAVVSLETPEGKESFTSAAFRNLLGTRDLRSTDFNVEEVDKTVYVSREEVLPAQAITELVSRQSLASKQVPVTKPLSPRDKIYLMNGAGALADVDVTSANPLVAISGSGFLNTVYQGLSARTEETRSAPQGFSISRVTRTVRSRKKTVWVPIKIPVAVSFTGKGWGHGVGLCQWGARGMALEGKTYAEILHYYYKDVELKKTD